MPTRTVMQQDNRSSRHDGVAKSGQRGEREPVGWPFIDYRFGHGDEQKPLAVQWPKLCPLKRLFRGVHGRRGPGIIWPPTIESNFVDQRPIKILPPRRRESREWGCRSKTFHPQTRVFILCADLFQKIAKNLRIYRGSSKSSIVQSTFSKL